MRRSGRPAEEGSEDGRSGCQVWVASQSAFADWGAALDRCLVPEERDYVERHRAGASTLRLSRALLRLLLAGYLHRSAAELRIDRRCRVCGEPHGKPVLTDAAATTTSPQDGTGSPATVHTSVSHSGDLLVVACTTVGPVGLDVEPVGTAPPEAELLDFALTPAERRRVRQAPAAQQSLAFLHCWTAKEAVLKAVGTGLDVPPSAVALPPQQGGGTASVRLPGAAPRTLWVRDVEVAPGYVCSLAIGQEIAELQVATLTPELVLPPGSRADQAVPAPTGASSSTSSP